MLGTLKLTRVGLLGESLPHSFRRRWPISTRNIPKVHLTYGLFNKLITNTNGLIFRGQ